MVSSATYRTRRPAFWVAMILLAVIVHVLLFFLVKPSYLGIFSRSLDEGEPSPSSLASYPRAIIAIPVDLEEDEPRPVEIPEPTRPQTQANAEAQRTGDSDAQDVQDILDGPQAPRTGTPYTQAAVIPPKPVEITWPSTKNLRHCLGLRVTIVLQVGPGGEILSAKPVSDELPEDCSAAALKAARRIIFLPGTINGKPTTMWTHIQIDFRDPSG